VPEAPRSPLRPRPLADWPLAGRATIAGVLTDIDDTLTRDGAIEPAALAALHALAAAGLPVLAITGRPAGWSEPFALAWPVAAIVAENGAVALVNDQGRLRREFLQDEATRTRNFAQLQRVAQRVLREVPGSALAHDSPGRLTDIAIDHSEFHHLGAAPIEQVVALMRAEGLNATVSSIHINGWIGAHDKPTGAAWMVERLWGRRLAQERERWLYVGDSTNDQAMFAQLPNSVGVANLLRFERQLHTWPAWITRGERGEGFAEAVRAVLQARA
jgi:HAD superfamily hydrolase (TIGR01484 family)